MNMKKRINKLEEQAEHYQEQMLDQNQEEDEVTALFRVLGEKGLRQALRAIDGKTRRLPSESVKGRGLWT